MPRPSADLYTHQVVRLYHYPEMSIPARLSYCADLVALAHPRLTALARTILRDTLHDLTKDRT